MSKDVNAFKSLNQVAYMFAIDAYNEQLVSMKAMQYLCDPFLSPRFLTDPHL